MQTNSSSLASDLPPRLLIVDGHSFAYRAFYAIRKLTSPTGKATNAIYGFIRMLGKTRAMLQPSHIVVVWDGGLAAERMALLPEYKAQRKEMPSDLEEQFDHMVAYLQAAGISSWVKNGVEADDCIAALTQQAGRNGVAVVIASSDKDFMQLVTPQAQLLAPSGTLETLIGVEEVKVKTGVAPSQIVDWLSLIGDSVDNIPGVPGIGPKTATELLQKFGSIEQLYARLSEVSSERLRTKLQAAAEFVKRNQKLVRLDVEVPCELRLEGLAVKKADNDRLRQLFDLWGFKTLVRELEEQFESGDLFR